MIVSGKMSLDIRYKKGISRLKELSHVRRVNSSCDNTLVSVVYEFIVGDIVYSNKEWWFFEEGIWKKDGGKYMWNVLTETFIEFLNEEENTRKDIPIHEIIQSLGSSTTTMRLMKALSFKLEDSEFHNKLNSNTNLLGMKGGVYAFEEKSFREMLSSDYVSMSCGVKYRRKYKDQDIKGLMNILNQIFPKREVKEFFIRTCSSMLEGYNKHKVFYCWWGKGNNAKTMMQRFISSILGDYSASLSTSLITGKRANSSDATPDMHYAKNKLVVFLQEPNPDEKIQVGRIKELTGNDKIYSRELFKSGESMEFRAKIVIVANNALEVPGMDIAFRKRIVVIPFESTFTNSKDSGEYVFDEDVDMEEKIFKYRELFMALLLEEYPKFVEEGLNIPEYIREKTSEYITLNNHVLKYIRTELSHSPGSEPLIEVYQGFKEWFKESCPGRRIPSLASFSTELRNEGYHEVNGKIKNISYC